MNFVPLTLYLMVMTITPGPNNLVLASSGVRFGFSRTLPAMLGMALGLACQVAILAVALGHIKDLMADLQLWLALAGCGYLLWLAWQMTRAGQPGEAGAAARPMGFAGGALFNWLNPNVWLMSVNLALLFLPSGMPLWQAGGLFAVVAFMVALPCIGVWAWGGVAMARFLGSPRRLAAFNWVMASLLAGMALWLVADKLPAEAMDMVPFV